MSLEETLSRILKENRQARERSSDRLSRLIDATATGDHDEFDRITDELTGSQSSSEVSGSDGTAEAVERDHGESSDSGHAPGADAEPEGGVSLDTQSPLEQ